MGCHQVPILLNNKGEYIYFTFREPGHSINYPIRQSYGRSTIQNIIQKDGKSFRKRLYQSPECGGKCDLGEHDMAVDFRHAGLSISETVDHYGFPTQKKPNKKYIGNTLE